MQVQELKVYSPEEYLAMEEAAEFRSEYHDGEIVPMTGGTFNHNRIAGAVYAYLRFALRNKGFEAFTSDVLLWIPSYQRFTYPDVMTVEGEPIAYNNRTDTLTNPRLIIEVLSKSTQECDRQDKFRFYRSISELQEYVLISQYEIAIEHYIKTGNKLWMFREYEADDQVIKLESVNIELNIADIYEGVNFQETLTQTSEV